MSRIERFTGSAVEWNTFARSQRGYTHFHRYEWRALIERVFGHECIYLAAYDEQGAVQGILPLVRVKSIVFGHYLVSMPFVNYGGPLGTDAGVRAVVGEAVALARAGNVKLLELRSRTPQPIDLPASHRKITVLLDLAGTPDAVFKRFEPKLRSQIRRPQKEGVTVKFGATEAEGFYRVFAEHMRDLGTPVQSRTLFSAIAETFPDDAWFACAYLRGEAVAGGCGFRFGDEFEMTWASSLRAYNREAPNMLLYWSLMERAMESGARCFNFGRCTPGSGTHRFKSQWGGRDEPLWWYDVSASADTHTPSPDDGAYSWGPRLWRHLPTRVATALGPKIVRFIP
jgi:serine/alanine adding enzyme